jgi:hypothetical protein
VDSEAEIGQSMISTARLLTFSAVSLTEEVIHRGSSYTLTIEPGVLVKRATNEAGTFYRVQGPANLTTLGIRQRNTEGGVFIPNDPSSPTEVYWDWGPVRAIHPGIQHKPSTVETMGKESFKRELVYSGVSQNTVSILYREFKDDLARPAFSQELKYDLAQGNTIGYKGARFQVINANNTVIRFTVLKPLD